MQINSGPNGKSITTVDQNIDHYPYPCPPSRDPQISCEKAWELWAKAKGAKILRPLEKA